MIVTVCGGGHTGHVCAGFLAGKSSCRVRLLTRQPARWSTTLRIDTPEGESFEGCLDCVTSDPKEALQGAQLVLLCLPGFSIEEVLMQIGPYLGSDVPVGSVVSSTGFFFKALDILPHNQPLFGFQRVPFISRISEYGHSASLLGYKKSLAAAVLQSRNPEKVVSTLETLFKTPVRLLEGHYEASLTNSNPLLHTSRLYSLWKDYRKGDTFERNPFFYSDWTCEASTLLLAMDSEFQTLLSKLGVREGAVPPIADYYESPTPEALASKLRSIDAFQGILSPMKEVEGGRFIPDFTSRYFTEDFPFGLSFIRNLAHEKGVPCPEMDKVYEWGLKMLQNN